MERTHASTSDHQPTLCADQQLLQLVCHHQHGRCSWRLRVKRGQAGAVCERQQPQALQLPLPGAARPGRDVHIAQAVGQQRAQLLLPVHELVHAARL